LVQIFPIIYNISTTMNTIPEKQNQESNLKLLAAQRQLYSEAKFFQILSFILSFPVTLVISFLTSFVVWLQPYSVLYGILISILELTFLSKKQKDNQEKAAQIQQEFDCNVLELNWHKLNCGNKVDREIIQEFNKKYKSKNNNYSDLEDWYSCSIINAPILYARLICQRSNIWWDSQLRIRYANTFFITFIIFTFIIFIIGCVRNFNFQTFIVIIGQLAPSIIFTYRQYNDNKEAAEKLNLLKNRAEIFIEKTKEGHLRKEALEKESYQLQNQIYNNRRLNPPIINWFYTRLRNENEESMNIAVEDLVEDLKKSNIF